MGKSKLSKAELVFHETKNYFVLIHGQARRYGLSLEMSAFLKGPTLQTWMTQNWPNIFRSFFWYMKILNISDYLQLVSSIYVFSSLNESILKKSYQENYFHCWLKMVIFWKTLKNTQLWPTIVTKPLNQNWILRYQ